MIGWLIFMIGAGALIVGLLYYFFRRDQRYLHGRTRDALSPELREEIESEVEAAKHRQQLFRNALESASKSAESQDNSLTKV